MYVYSYYGKWIKYGKNRKRKGIEKNKPFIENEEYMETSDEEGK